MTNNKLNALREKYEKEKAKSAGKGGGGLDKYVSLDYDETAELRILPIADDVNDYHLESGMHYIDKETKVNCPRVNGDKCPICEAYFDIWKDINETEPKFDVKSPTPLQKALHELTKKSKSTSRYYYNVLDRRDGNVKIMAQGYKVYAKIMDGQFDPDWGDGEVSVADPENGWDFKLTLKKVDGYNNYDTSTFRPKSSSLGTPDEVEELMSQRHDLSELIVEKPYEELELVAEGIRAEHRLIMQPQETAGMEPTDGEGIGSEEDFIKSLE